MAEVGWNGGRGPKTPALGVRKGIDQAWTSPVHGLYPDGQATGGRCDWVAALDPTPAGGVPPEPEPEPELLEPLERCLELRLEQMEPPPEPDWGPESPEPVVGTEEPPRLA